MKSGENVEKFLWIGLVYPASHQLPRIGNVAGMKINLPNTALLGLS